MKFRTRFSDPVGVPLMCTLEEKRTKSEFAAECDINQIMARYRKTGILPEAGRAAAARFGDFSQVPSFAEMQDKIIAANDLFMLLPSDVRKVFDNDPGAFVAAADSEEGREYLVKLGLGKEGKPTPSPAEPAPAHAVEKTAAPEKGAPPTKSVKD